MTKEIDITGQKFNRLTATRKIDGRKWLFVCDCGTEVVKGKRNVLDGKTGSCGCLIRERKQNQREDVTGQRFGKLIAIEYSHSVKKHGTDAIWRWKCDCGNEILSRPSVVKLGNTRSCSKSCGSKIDGNDPRFFRQKYMTYVSNDLKLGREFSLTLEEFIEITSKDCHYCGEPPSAYVRTRTKRGLMNGIDRVDSSKGHTKDNIVPCCAMCNFMKGTFGYEEFLTKIRKIAAKHPE